MVPSSYVDEISIWFWSYLNDVFWQFLIAITTYFITCIILYHLLKRVDHYAWQFPGPPKKLLILTAHPDDEVMFFGPLICSLRKRNRTQIYLLCLTMGGNKKRKDELWNCAKSLGIPESNVTLLMNSDFPDDPTVRWSENLVAENVLHFIEIYGINAVATFDKHGVSGHKNHSSLFYGVASLCMEKRVPSYCKIYILESVNRFFKYTQLLDLPISLLSSSYWFLITYEQRRLVQDAMMKHKSQYVWFRKLYMLFSRYTLFNTFQELNSLDLELDLQLED